MPRCVASTTPAFSIEMELPAVTGSSGPPVMAKIPILGSMTPLFTMLIELSALKVRA